MQTLNVSNANKQATLSKKCRNGQNSYPAG